MIEQGKGGRIIGAASIASKQGLFLIMTQSNQFWKFSNDIGQRLAYASHLQYK